jgi:hypothetical protein
MPRLMQRLGKIAPNVAIDLRRLSEATPKFLESGQGDLAVGFVEPMGAGFASRGCSRRGLCALAGTIHG